MISAPSLHSARAIYEQASDVLGYDMTKLSHESPDDQISLTRYTQPVLLTHYIACLTVWRELAATPITPVMAASHNLGEYSALVAAERPQLRRCPEAGLSPRRN
ncbi:MAG: hypothetical protein RNU03_00015 [Candidatus Sedimenticola sp. (ex Thyasira tokunagai)]